MNQTNNYNNRKNINTKNIPISETKTVKIWWKKFTLTASLKMAKKH